MCRNHDAHLPRDTKGRRVEEQINQINATYESIDAQIKKNCNTGTAMERVVEKLLGALTSFTREKPHS